MNLIEIFKAGKRQDAHGVEINITTEDLQQAVESYSPEYHEAPAVVGHPQHNHPAYGWVKRLELDGDVLKAEFDQIDPEFAEMVEAGRFKKVSASFYLANSPNNPKQGSLYLRHVGFLGAMPPAVKGLRNPAFAESEEGVVDFCEPVDTEPQTSTPNGELSMTQEEIDALLAENEQLKADKAKAEAEKAEAELEAVKAENANFCEQLIGEGKLAPVAKDAALNLLNHSATVASGGVVNFNEGESLLTVAKAFLEAQPKIVEFNEVADPKKAAEPEPDTVSYAEGTNPASIEADQKIRAYMKQHSVDYTTAFKQLFN